MKRGKVFSILASAAMVFGLSTPLKVSAQETGLPDPVNGVITLTDDVNLAATQVINQDVTLDLNGHNISSVATVLEVNNGATLTVKDTTANSRPNVVNNSSVENYKSGKIQSTNNNGIKVLNNSKLILSNGIIQAKNLGVGVVGNTSTSSDEVKSSFVMNGGYILSQEFSVCVYGKKATFTLNNGVLESKDNTCVGNNGSISKDEDMGGTEININGGNIIGHIQSSGYIANGISQANYGTLNISGGVIYADGGCGVIARAGKVNITGGKIITTGTSSGYIGDRRDSVQCNGIVLDAQAQYPGWDYNGNNAEINITGNVEVLTNSSCKAIEAMGASKNGVTAKSRIKVSAGTYSSDVSDYVDNFFNKSYKIGDYYKVLPPALDIDTSDTEGMINGVLSIELGKEKTINAVVKPFNTPDKATFSSDNEKVATVDENGKVTALSTGVAVITIQA